MCGRYYIADEDSAEELRQIIAEVQHSLNRDVPLKTHGEIYPSDVVPIRIQASPLNNEQAVIAAKWGFTMPSKPQLLINARCESIGEKPMFRNAKPCAVPATNYFEWETIQPGVNENAPVQIGFGGIESAMTKSKGKQPKPRKEKRAIRPNSASNIFYMAGLLRQETDSPAPVFTIITREAAPELRHIHDRMPLILSGEQVTDWLKQGVLPDLEKPRVSTYKAVVAI